MEVKAKLRYLHIAPRKVRLVIDLIRGLDVNKALQKLDFIEKRGAKPVAKLLKSAMANAEHNFNLDKNNLYIKEIRADEGPKLKRWQPRAFGRAYPILKRASHVSIILEEKVPQIRETKKEKPQAAELPLVSKQPPLTKKIDIQEQKLPPRVTAGGKIWDRTKLASRRHKQHADKKTLERQKRLRRIRRFFQRKSV